MNVEVLKEAWLAEAAEAHIHGWGFFHIYPMCRKTPCFSYGACQGMIIVPIHHNLNRFSRFYGLNEAP